MSFGQTFANTIWRVAYNCRLTRRLQMSLYDACKLSLASRLQVSFDQTLQMSLDDACKFSLASRLQMSFGQSLTNAKLRASLTKLKQK